jgi:spore germination protein YaaH
MEISLCDRISFAAGYGIRYYLTFWPNSKHVPPDFGGVDKPVFYQGIAVGASVIGQKEGLKLPLSVFQDKIDPAIRYEEGTQSVIITTRNKVVHLQTSKLTGTVNAKPFDLRFPVERKGETVYLPLEPLKDLYRIDVTEDATTGAVLLKKAGDRIQWGTPSIPKDSLATKPLRSQPSVKAPIYADLKRGEKVMIWDEHNGWYRLQQQNGVVGYAAQNDIVRDRLETVPAVDSTPDYVPWKPLGGKINLTWLQVYDKHPDTAKFPAMPGLNVISPQWFHLTDGEGNLQNLADASFAKWARTQNLQLWALFSNGFEPKRTSEALSTFDRRLTMIKQLVSFAKMYKIQGINIDFENVYLKDKENFVQFIRELTPLLHEQGLVVSIDVTVKDGSANYSRFLDRKAIGEVVDYMMLMAYDEHWATSPEAGPVSSLPWSESGLSRILAEDDVPPAKMILAVPYYTRIWTETTDVDGKITVKSKTGSMEAVQKIIKDKELKPIIDHEAGLNYVQYEENGNMVKIWIEDAVSMGSRLDLIRKYQLAGIASWSRGFETADIWQLIQKALVGKQ